MFLLQKNQADYEDEQFFFSNVKRFSDTSQHFYISNDNTFKMVNSAIKLTATRKACGIKSLQLWLVKCTTACSEMLMRMYSTIFFCLSVTCAFYNELSTCGKILFWLTKKQLDLVDITSSTFNFQETYKIKTSECQPRFFLKDLVRFTP